MPTIIPSPQISEQIEFVAPVHVQPDSTWQEVSHPSEMAGVPSLSSHVSEPKMSPSPHIGEQVVIVVKLPPEQVHPGVSRAQVELQPSLLIVLPSSQASVNYM